MPVSSTETINDTHKKTSYWNADRIAEMISGHPEQKFILTNNLSQLIPLGTLFVHGNGSEGSAAPIKAPDSWFWLEPGSRLLSLDLLVSRNTIKVTYKPISLGYISFYILRVYAIPKCSKLPPMIYHKKRACDTMKSLICLMDYSKESWDVEDAQSLSRYMRQTELPIICSDIPLVDRNITHHLKRLKHGLPYSYGPKSEESVEQRLLKLYDAIPSPVSRSCKVEGISSELFPYQKRSLAQMLEMEAPSKNISMGVPFKGGYLDSSTFEVLETPGFFTTARGGILAENMGLGKTLICLALITTTRWQSSEMPQNALDKLTKMSGPVRSLSEYSVRELNRNSFSWKGFNLPDSCVKLLCRNPPTFQVYKPRIGRKSKRVTYETRSIPVILSTTTLIVCPKNIWHQWMAEIEKHVCPGFLKVLGASEPDIPSAQKLVLYDLVVMSTLAFAYHSDQQDSPLREVHWKRLIVDEGHSMNAKNSKAVLMSRDLSVERRWIISGTPTAGLTQLHMNEEAQSEYVVKRKFSAQDDLKRLGSLVEYFFKMSPWTSVKWSNTVMKSFVSGCSEDLVQTLLNSVLVRHCIGDVDKDVTLPPLRHEAVFLDPSYHDKLSVNLFISVLAANAVTSERVDQDYMFHPSNRSDLQRLISNLQRATFYWTGFTVNDIEVLLSLCKLALDKETPQSEPYYSPGDRMLLSKCLKTSKFALANQRWRTASAIHEMNYFVSGLSDIYTRSFATGTLDRLSVFGAPHLHSAQKFYFKNRFTTGESLESKIDQHSKDFWLEYWKYTEKKNTQRARLGEGQQIDKHAVKENYKNDTELTYAPLNVPVESTKNASFVGTVSAKLSYLGARLMDHQATMTKSIVFFEFEDSAYYLTELLDLLGVEYIMYATFVKPGERSKNLNTFARSEKGIPLIMDLKLASHGLTIIEATRVYFINPIWRKAVEAQAIKRAHRIGQSSAVVVETLILKGTIEEEMYKKHLDVETETASLIDDSGMQEYVTRHEFLPYNDRKEWEPFSAPLIHGSVAAEDNGEYSLRFPSCTDDGVWHVPVFSALCLDKMACTEYRAKRAYSGGRKSIKRVRFI